jgi:UDP-N-acetylglucosamine diphosphorylase / glucose-1-phosphate thymidylyltransferase / UDP-N-acetylgalactosamine diphosphorylase / glucosamine-1-phosphate N-acetyltransferase / galactosamine-1-phosphate N-acetyltransferase
MDQFTKDALDEIAEIVRPAGIQLPLEDIVNPWDLFKILDMMKRGCEGEPQDIERGSISLVTGSVYASQGSSMGDYTKIVGPVILGEGAQICDYGYVLGPAIIGRGARISAQVARSIILSGTQALHRDTYIGDSIVGRDCNFGAGTNVANLRFDGKPPRVFREERAYEPGREKLGAIIEHRVKFGINSSVSPGTHIPAGKLWIGNGIYEKM